MTLMLKTPVSEEGKSSINTTCHSSSTPYLASLQYITHNSNDHHHHHIQGNHDHHDHLHKPLLLNCDISQPQSLCCSPIGGNFGVLLEQSGGLMMVMVMVMVMVALVIVVKMEVATRMMMLVAIRA